MLYLPGPASSPLSYSFDVVTMGKLVGVLGECNTRSLGHRLIRANVRARVRLSCNVDAPGSNI
jgi:hypothetical protein